MNTNAKHTPGPWENHKWNCKEHQISGKGGTIALVSHSHSLVSEAEADANARLIAAAPALLIELKNTVAAIEKWGKEHPESGGWIGVIHGALKAIAQAEGGAQ